MDAIEIQKLTSPDIEINPQLEIEKGMYELAIKWLTEKSGVCARLKDCLPVTRSNLGSMVDLQANIARVFLHMSYWSASDPRIARFLGLDMGKGGNLWQALYGKYNDSLVCRLGRGMYEDVYSTFIGPASVVTFCELLQRASPDAFSKLNPLSIIASAKDDIENKIDLVLDFGTTNKDGRKVYRLVQLKTDGQGQAGVARVHPDDVKSSYFGSVTKRDAMNMLRGATYFSNLLDAEVRSFVVLVPAFDSYICNNPLGKLQSSLDETVSIFAQESLREGLIPKAKI